MIKQLEIENTKIYFGLRKTLSQVKKKEERNPEYCNLKTSIFSMGFGAVGLSF